MRRSAGYGQLEAAKVERNPIMLVKSDRPRFNGRKASWKRLFIPIFLVVLIVPAWGADKSKDEETLRNASTVLSAMLDANSVPPDLLTRAYCVVVLPSVKKFGFGVGGGGGRGPMSCRGGQGFQRHLVRSGDVLH